MTGDELTERQRIFVAEYARCGNATTAAIKAGYAEKSARGTGSRLLTNANVSAALAKRRKARDARLEIAEDYELTHAEQLFRMCTGQVDVPIRDKSGELTYSRVFEANGANGALTLMAKLRGKMVQKVEVGFADSLAEDLEAAADDDKR